MTKSRNKSKKTPAEVKQYKNSLGQNELGMSGTYDIKDSFLTGSDKFSSEYGRKSDKKLPIKKKSVWLIITDWLKENWASLLISGILISVIGWGVLCIIDTQKDQAVCAYRIQQLEQDLEKIAGDIPDKEIIELKISTLKADLEKSDFEGLKERIIVLENEVKTLKDLKN